MNSEKERVIDSLKQIIDSDVHDTTRITAYFEWDNLIYIEDPELDKEINERVIEIANENLSDKNVDPILARYYWGCETRCLNVLGLIYNDYGNYSEAAKYLHLSLEIARALGEKKAMAGPPNNLGMIYKSLGFHEKSMMFYMQAMEMDGDDDWAKAIYLNNLGVVNIELGRPKVAKMYYLQSIELSEKVGNESNLANSVGNIGEIYFKSGDYDSAIFYFKKAIALNKDLGSDYNVAFWQGRTGRMYYIKNVYDTSLAYCDSTYVLLETVTSLITEADCEYCLYLNYRELGEPEKAMYHLETYVTLNDSITSKNELDKIITEQFQKDFERKRVEDSLKVVSFQKVKEVQLQGDLDKQEVYKYFLFLGLGVLTLIIGLVYRSYRRKMNDNEIISKQKEEVENQKVLVEVKNKEITDSINYAKRIQDAILPSPKMVEEGLGDSFLVYSPKDIVAGDFYWFEKRIQNGNELTFIAVADCTGHGVPGAMVSVVCANALNKAVNEFLLVDPGKILNKVRDLVIDSFSKNEGEIKDGMDIALCVVDFNNKKLSFSGANNPLWIISNKFDVKNKYVSADGSKGLLEIKGDKQPIGAYALNENFNTHVIEFGTGDQFYLFSDGYPDQFGGEKGKKFKYSNFKKTLLDLSNLDMNTQGEKLKVIFNNWKGELEQVDDVCVLGFRIK